MFTKKAGLSGFFVSLIFTCHHNTVSFLPRILIIEDDLSFAHLLENFLQRKGYHTRTAGKLSLAIKELEKENFSLILLDFNLPDGNGFKLLEFLRSHDIQSSVVIMTAFNDIRTAVKAIHMGARDYILKPVNHEELLKLVQETTATPDTEKPDSEQEFIKGESKVAAEMHRQLQLVAPTDMSVIILGENGTGKENAARTIHKLSNRSKGPFVAVDCGALSEELASSELFGHVRGAFTGAVTDKKGKFEEAAGGTLFLDEIGNLSYTVQVKLLRAIQEKELTPVGSNKIIKTDVRFVCATNEDLKTKVEKGLFREDLYHRLNEFSVTVPPLRNRDKDIELFIAHFLELSNKELNKNVKGFSKEVKDLFTGYSWPGNLRELKYMVKRAVLLAAGEVITLADIPTEMLSAPAAENNKTNDLRAMNEQNEKELIQKVLKETRYNKSKAADLLKIDRKTLYQKIMKYGIET